MKHKSHSQNYKPDALFVELKEEDRKYGDKKLERPQSEIRQQKRPIKNLTKAWMEHQDDFDEIEDFYGR
jgi:hypothetical protein